MTIALFKTLIAISETGSFQGAADRVCVTSAAVGQQMFRLEDMLGVKLFDRSEKTPRLNQLGKAFVPKARAVVYAYETVLDDLTGDPRMIGELIIGAVPSVMRSLIPQAMQGLVRNYPELHIRVTPDLSPDLLEQVEQGILDVAVLSKPMRIADHFNWTPICDEPLVLLTAPDVTLNDPVEILRTMPYIRHTRKAAVGMLSEQWLSQQNIKVRDSMEMGSLENIASMVANGLGVSVGPNICVPDPIFSSLKKIPLGKGVPSRTLGLLTRTDCFKLQLVDKLLEQINVVLARQCRE